MPAALKMLIIGIVEPDEIFRETLELLLALGLGMPVRSAPSLPRLETTLSTDEELILVVGTSRALRDIHDGILFGSMEIDGPPIDASRLLRDVRSRLAAAGSLPD